MDRDAPNEKTLIKPKSKTHKKKERTKKEDEEALNANVALKFIKETEE